MLEHRFERHDRSQVELKLSYLLDSKKAQQNYRVETYIFVPRTLNITKQSYAKGRFYEDTTTFIRLKSPRVALSSLAKKSGAALWLKPIKQEVEAFLSGQGGSLEDAINQLKLVGCTITSALRDEKDEEGSSAGFRIRCRKSPATLP